MKKTITVRAKLMTANDNDDYSNISDQSNNNDISKLMIDYIDEYDQRVGKKL